MKQVENLDYNINPNKGNPIVAPPDVMEIAHKVDDIVDWINKFEENNSAIKIPHIKEEDILKFKEIMKNQYGCIIKPVDFI